MLRCRPGRTLCRVGPGAEGGDAQQRFALHPDFPHLPPSTPLTYVLTMQAALSEHAAERPSFADIVTLLTDNMDEVATGAYINSEGNQVVRARTPGRARFVWRAGAQVVFRAWQLHTYCLPAAPHNAHY